MKYAAFMLVVLCSVTGCGESQPQVKAPVRVGSKKFTESVLLGEMAVASLRGVGVDATRTDLGGTPACWLALTQGDIDAYPEYTGTITKQILKAEPTDLNIALAVHGVRMSKSLGFRNNYALGMRKDVAAQKQIRTISDLLRHPDLKCGFIHEFLDRDDGWPGLKKHYNLPQTNVVGMNHTLAYQALVERSLDVMELYTTDGEIAQFDLAVLDDDRNFFPAYEAVWLTRITWEEANPNAARALRMWEGKINAAEMQRLNNSVQAEKADEVTTATTFTNEKFGTSTVATEDSWRSRLWLTTREHLALVVPSLLAAIIVSIPLGILAARRPTLGTFLFGFTGILQTIPSLALLLFMIPVMKFLTGTGTGVGPAIAALFLYSLLPIVRNTATGLTSIAASLQESATALGLSRRAILFQIELPLALPTIIAGIKTAAIINVGSATLGGFIGAGGYGRPILRGLDKFDVPLMLEGAIPAAVMALAVEAVFSLLERLLKAR